MPAPSPLAVRTWSWLTSLSQHLDVRPGAAPARSRCRAGPAPTTWTGPVELSCIGHRAHPGQVAAQRGGAVQVDVGDVRRGAGRSRRGPSSAPPAASSRSISSSRAHISGTSPKPSWRAAYAGNSACRSPVAVKITLMKSSTVEIVGVHHVAHHLGDPVEHVVAVVGLELGRSPHGADGHGSSSVAGDPRDLSLQSRPRPAACPSSRGVSSRSSPCLSRPSAHRADPGAGQPSHRVADVVEQPAHDPVAALVDHQLDDASARRGWSAPRPRTP